MFNFELPEISTPKKQKPKDKHIKTRTIIGKIIKEIFFTTKFMK
jgi:hypothetical protein